MVHGFEDLQYCPLVLCEDLVGGVHLILDLLYSLLDSVCVPCCFVPPFLYPIQATFYVHAMIGLWVCSGVAQIVLCVSVLSFKEGKGFVRVGGCVVGDVWVQ